MSKCKQSCTCLINTHFIITGESFLHKIGSTVPEKDLWENQTKRDDIHLLERKEKSSKSVTAEEPHLPALGHSVRAAERLKASSSTAAGREAELPSAAEHQEGKMCQTSLKLNRRYIKAVLQPIYLSSAQFLKLQPSSSRPCFALHTWEWPM